ncbi:hypothetical protein AAHB53_10985 [Niallia circulans]
MEKKVLPIAVISSLTVAGLATVLTGTDAEAKKMETITENRKMLSF